MLCTTCVTILVARSSLEIFLEFQICERHFWPRGNIIGGGSQYPVTAMALWIELTQWCLQSFSIIHIPFFQNSLILFGYKLKSTYFYVLRNPNFALATGNVSVSPIPWKNYVFYPSSVVKLQPQCWRLCPNFHCNFFRTCQTLLRYKDFILKHSQSIFPPTMHHKLHSDDLRRLTYSLLLIVLTFLFLCAGE